MWSFDVFGVHTGQPLGKIPVTGFDAACSLNQGEGATIQVPTNHPDWVGENWDYLLMPTRRIVVVSWAGVAQFAGIVWEWEKDYGASSRTYVLRDVWSVLRGRHLVDSSKANPSESLIEFGPANLSTLAGRVVMHGTTAAEYLDDLPMSYPPFVAGTTTLSYRGHTATNVAEALERIISWQGGPDVWFRPLINESTGAFSWDMMAEPDLYRDHLWEANLDADGVNLKRRVDASGIITRAYVYGEGAGSKTPAAKSTHTDQTYLTMERVSKDHKTRVVPPLQAYADRLVNTYANPVDEYTLTVPPTYLEHLRPGMSLKVNGASDPDFPSEVTFRVAGYSFSDSGTVTVDLF